MIPDRPIIVKENGEEKEYKPTLANSVKYVPELKNEYEKYEEQLENVADELVAQGITITWNTMPDR